MNDFLGDDNCKISEELIFYIKKAGERDCSRALTTETKIE
jgi:hypothetical protein